MLVQYNQYHVFLCPRRKDNPHMKRFLAILLVMASLFTLLISCKKGNPTTDETTTSSGETTSVRPTEPGENDLIIAKDNVSNYIIMLSKDSKTASVELEVATALRDIIFNISGVRLRIATATKQNETAHEILIGQTVREGSVVEVDRTSLGDDGYHVFTQDQRIVFAANSVEGYWNGLYEFIKQYLYYDCYTDASAPERVGILFVPDNINIYEGIGGVASSINGVALTQFKVVCGDGFNDSAKYVYNAIRALTGNSPEMIYDSTKKIGDYEIILGPSARDGEYYTADYSSIGKDECKVISSGSRLAFLTESPEAALYAVKTFFSEHFDYIEDCLYPQSDIAYTQDANTVLSYSAASAEVSFAYTAYGDFEYSSVLSHRTNSFAGVSNNTDVCYSDSAESIKARVLNEIMLKYSKKPVDPVVVSLTYNTALPVCHCDACEKAAQEEGTELGAYYRMLISVAEAVAEQYPDAYVSIAANNSTMMPPKTKLPDNVIVYFVAWNCCANHAINDKNCKTNMAYQEALEAWNSNCKTLYVLDMTSDYYYYPAFFPNFYTVLKNVNYYAQLGVDGVILQYDTKMSSLEFGELRGYLYAELLANPTMTEEEYREHMLNYISKIYDYSNQQAIFDFINLMCEHSADTCWTPFDRPNITVPIARSTDNSGKTTYDLTVAIEAYRLWEVIHPYYEALATNETYFGQMVFNQYQRKAEGFSYVSFTEWLTANIDYQDKAWVLNEMYDALGISHN